MSHAGVVSGGTRSNEQGFNRGRIAIAGTSGVLHGTMTSLACGEENQGEGEGKESTHETTPYAEKNGLTLPEIAC